MRVLSPDSSTADNTEICGESFDHDTEITYEDEETRHWICRRCDAEGWEDFDE